MNDEPKEWKMINTQMAADVHTALRILAKRYKKQHAIKGKVPYSDALRFFIEEHEPGLAKAAADQAEESDKLADQD